MNKVIKPFFDKKNNNKPYSVGQTFEGSDKRVSELIDKGYLNGEKPKKSSTKKSDK